MTVRPPAEPTAGAIESAASAVSALSVVSTVSAVSGPRVSSGAP
jgi:hypothetical protein